MNSRLLCVVAGGVLLAGCGASNAASSHRTPTAAATSQPTAASLPPTTAPSVRPTSPPQISSSSDPGSAYKTARSELRAHNFSAAARHFKQAVKKGKNRADAYAGLGNADLRLGQYMDAYHAYAKAVHLKPNDANYLYGASLAAYTAKQFPESLQYSTRYIKLKPNAPIGYHLRILANDSLGHTKPQLPDALKIVHLQPKNAQAFNDLAIAYGNNRKYQQALEAFGKAIALDKKNYSFYFNRAVIENVVKERSAAIADMEKARALAPTKASKKAIAAFERRIQSKKG